MVIISYLEAKGGTVEPCDDKTKEEGPCDCSQSIDCDQRANPRFVLFQGNIFAYIKAYKPHRCVQGGSSQHDVWHSPKPLFRNWRENEKPGG